MAAISIDDRTEWLETDGRGGFASGTTSRIRTRRYHALLLPAMTPPTGRIVLVNGFDAFVETAGGRFAALRRCAGGHGRRERGLSSRPALVSRFSIRHRTRARAG